MPADFEHRLELLAHDVIRPRDERRLAIVRVEQLRVSSASPALDPARDDPSRMRAGRARARRPDPDGVGSDERFALAIEPAKHGVGELARADAVAALGQLDGLRDGRVGRHALHEEELRRAEAEQVEQIGVEPDDAAADARVEVRIEPRAAPQHAVHQLAHPATIARVETRGAAIERRIEQVTGREGRRRSRRRRRARRSRRRPPLHDTATPRRCTPSPPGDRWS